MMLAPVPMGVLGVAPRIVSSVIVAVRSVIAARIVASIIGSVMIVAGVTPVHHNRCGSDDNWRWNAEADVDIDAGLGGLRLRKQYES